MKKLIIIALTAIFPLVLFADPAKKVNVSYNKETKKLKVEVIHPVVNPKDHFIDLITIIVDGKELKVIKPKKQTGNKAELLEIEIPEIKSGSKVEVKTRCNQFGTKSGKLKVK